MRAQFFVDAVVDCLDGLRQLEDALRNPERPLSNREQTVEVSIQLAQKTFESFDLGKCETELTTLRGLNSANALPEHEGRINNEIANEVFALRRIIRHRLRSQVAIVIDTEAMMILEQRQLSEDAAQEFPVVSKHYAESAECYAMGFYAASMFHCMRAGGELVPQLAPIIFSGTEVELSPEVDLHDNWNRVLDQVESKAKKLDNRVAKKDPALEQKLRNLGIVIGDMRGLKIAWRDRVMHELNDVDRFDARNALQNMQALLEHLAKTNWN